MTRTPKLLALGLQHAEPQPAVGLQGGGSAHDQDIGPRRAVGRALDGDVRACGNEDSLCAGQLGSEVRCAVGVDHLAHIGGSGLGELIQLREFLMHAGIVTRGESLGELRGPMVARSAAIVRIPPLGMASRAFTQRFRIASSS